MSNDKCIKKAHHSEQFKNKLSKRLKIIEGQVRGINTMILDDVYCDDILNQISSIQGALGSVRNVLLEVHINSCVKDAFINGEEDVILELMSTLKKMMK